MSYIQDYVCGYVYSEDICTRDRIGTYGSPVKYLVELQLCLNNCICCKDGKMYVTNNIFKRPFSESKKDKLTKLRIITLKKLIDMYSVDNTSSLVNIINYIDDPGDTDIYDKKKTFNEIVAYILIDKRRRYIIGELLPYDIYSTRLPFGETFFKTRGIIVPQHVYSPYDIFTYHCEIDNGESHLYYNQLVLNDKFSYRYLFKPGYYKTLYKFIRKRQVRHHILHTHICNLSFIVISITLVLITPKKYLSTLAASAVAVGCAVLA